MWMRWIKKIKKSVLLHSMYEMKKETKKKNPWIKLK